MNKDNAISKLEQAGYIVDSTTPLSEAVRSYVAKKDKHIIKFYANHTYIIDIYYNSPIDGIFETQGIKDLSLENAMGMYCKDHYQDKENEKILNDNDDLWLFSFQKLLKKCTFIHRTDVKIINVDGNLIVMDRVIADQMRLSLSAQTTEEDPKSIPWDQVITCYPDLVICKILLPFKIE